MVRIALKHGMAANIGFQSLPGSTSELSGQRAEMLLSSPGSLGTANAPDSSTRLRYLKTCFCHETLQTRLDIASSPILVGAIRTNERPWDPSRPFTWLEQDVLRFQNLPRKLGGTALQDIMYRGSPRNSWYASTGPEGAKYGGSDQSRPTPLSAAL